MERGNQLDILIQVFLYGAMLDGPFLDDGRLHIVIMGQINVRRDFTEGPVFIRFVIEVDIGPVDIDTSPPGLGGEHRHLAGTQSGRPHGRRRHILPVPAFGGTDVRDDFFIQGEMGRFRPHIARMYGA